MTSSIQKRIALVFVLFAAFLVYEYWKSDESNFLEYALGSWPFILLVLVASSSWILFGGFTDQAWDGLKAAFPDRFEQSEIPKHVAIGFVQLSTPDTEPVGPILTAAANDGLIIAKLKKNQKPKDFVCVPWSRITRVWVSEPKGLAACKSSKDCGKLAEKLSATVTISRGEFPAFEIEVPWHDMFGSKLPPSINLKKDWEWPYGLHTVI